MLPPANLVNDEYRKYFWGIFIEKNRNKFLNHKICSALHYLYENEENWFQ